MSYRRGFQTKCFAGRELISPDDADVRAAVIGSQPAEPELEDGSVYRTRWWALAESSLPESEYLETAEQKWPWLAIARKCRLSVRSDGSPAESWRGLIPDRDLDPTRIERDVFAMGRWLQEQELEPAMASFGASLTNAREIHRRGAISSRNLREALARWFSEGPRRADQS